MNIAIVVCLSMLGAFYFIFGLVVAYVDSLDHGFKWYRFTFLIFFYFIVDIWYCLSDKR